MTIVSHEKLKRSYRTQGLCSCGRAEKRSGQGNCRLCHSLANQIYRLRKREREELAHRNAIRAVTQKLPPAPPPIQWRDEPEELQ